jgi:hypothetical protein
MPVVPFHVSLENTEIELFQNKEGGKVIMY